MDATDTIKVVKLRALMESGDARAIRRDAGVSLPEAAIAADTHPTTIWRWEYRTRRPRVAPIAVRYYDFLSQLLEETSSPLGVSEPTID